MTRRSPSEKHADTGRSKVDMVDVDAEMLAFSTLVDIQHSDAHLLGTDCALDRPAEQWARAIMEDVPADVRATLERAWQVIALRLAPVGAADTIAGWPIAHACTEYVLLHAYSAFGFEGQLLVRCSESGVLLATFVQFHDPAARTIWDRALPTHLRFVRSLLSANATASP
ncbi:hypothetical protein [Nocardia gipuzkoensis]|uniref:hypothetical protein n=1 Tax=Nocardia gipuzkoensis TaxID=2749991 RepID=UPI00237E8C56|nr:hypothetical protein [Nocardia gipuzkoensis]MDE1675503.1 hypothetical protein [Nocardia gipuzkoensis]